MLQDWSGKIVIDVTNGFMLPPEVQQAEYQGRLTSEVNAKRVPGAKLVKAFNQLRFKVLASPLPDDVGRRVVFVSSDHEDASAAVAALAESLGFAAIEVGKIRRWDWRGVTPAAVKYSKQIINSHDNASRQGQVPGACLVSLREAFVDICLIFLKHATFSGVAFLVRGQSKAIYRPGTRPPRRGPCRT